MNIFFNVLPYTVISYNNPKNKIHGFSPYKLLFGHLLDLQKPFTKVTTLDGNKSADARH